MKRQLPYRKQRLKALIPALAGATVFLIASHAFAQAGATEQPVETKRSLLDFVTAGGVVGYLIIALSFVAVAMVVDLVLRTKREKLIPDGLIRHSLELAEQGRLNELLAMSRASDSMFGRMVSGALERGRLGIDAVRQEMQQLGEGEVLKMRSRVSHVGVVATAGPMLGLLGTVIGMISSFSVLGTSKNAARPDELATGISLALVTTCEGLILAVPLIFVHGWLRDRVTKISQELAHAGDRLLSTLAVTATRRHPTTQTIPPAPAAPQMSPQATPRMTMSPPAAGSMGAAPTGTLTNPSTTAPLSPEPSYSSHSPQTDLGGLLRG